MVTYAVIAAKDEEPTIGELVRSLIASGFKVVVIDDGSKDRTAAEALEAGAFVRTHAASKGIGPSLKEAWEIALDWGAERVVQVDAGGSHTAREAWFLSRALDHCDMVIGSRFCQGGEYHGRKWRALCSRFAAALLNWASHAHFSDWTSGYRAFTAATLRKLTQKHFYQTMHPWQIEVLGHAIHKGLTVHEFPITYRAGRSSLRWKTIDGAILEFLSLLFY